MGYFHKDVPGVMNRQARNEQREQMLGQGFAPAEAERQLAGYASPCYTDPVLRAHCPVVEGSEIFGAWPMKRGSV